MSDGSNLLSKLKFPLLIIGDILFFYGALLATLYLRYGALDTQSSIFKIHLVPFSWALLIWLLIFYSGGLYENLALKNRATFLRRFISLTLIGALLMVLLLYFVPAFGITPKINLLIFTLIFLGLGIFWHLIFAHFLRVRAGISKKQILFIGDGKTLKEIVEYIQTDPHLGYEIKNIISLRSGDEKAIEAILRKGSFLHAIVVPHSFYRNPEVVTGLYHRLLAGTEIITIPLFYERLFGRVSLEDIDETWLLQNLPQLETIYVGLKNIAEFFIGLIVFLIFAPVMIICGLIVALTSRGPIFYTQERTGYKGKSFRLFKFRSMYNDVDKNPDANSDKAIWTQKSDSRVTTFGKFLRFTHLDELPQLLNLLRGEVSFVGPRPERPIFIKDLKKSIPYYDLRHLVRPGITGWAQIRYPYGASVEDAYQKQQYDLYYLKHQSLLLDLTIVLKTIKYFFVLPPTSL